MKPDPKALELAHLVVNRADQMRGGNWESRTESKQETPLARAYLALAAEVERWAPVVAAAVEWREFDLSRDKHDAYGPLVTRMVEMCNAIDTAISTAEAGQP